MDLATRGLQLYAKDVHHKCGRVGGTHIEFIQDVLWVLHHKLV